MGVIQMKKKAQDTESPEFIRARAFTIIITLDKCKQRLEQQMGKASADWKEKLSDKTKEYRLILRDDDNSKASDKVRAGLFDQVRDLVAERDELMEAKKEDIKIRKGKISQIVEADAEAKLAHKSSDSTQLPLHIEETSRVAGMPWATDATLDVVYTALYDLDQRGATLDEFQAALLSELGAAEVKGADLGLEADEAIEDDTEVAEFESEDDEVDGDEELPF